MFGSDTALPLVRIVSDRTDPLRTRPAATRAEPISPLRDYDG